MNVASSELHIILRCQVTKGYILSEDGEDTGREMSLFGRKRSRTVMSPPPKPAVLLRKEPLITDHTSPASSKEVQEAFLKEVGMFTSEIDLKPQEVLTQEQAELLCVAMSHKAMELPGVVLSDPYFTEDQWKLVVNEKHSLLDEVMKKLKTFLGDHDEEKKEKKEELGSRLEELISHIDCSRMPLCLCIAHEVHEPKNVEDPKFFKMIQELGLHITSIK